MAAALSVLARIAFADITEAVELVDGKIRVKDTALWSPNLRAAVAEISDGRDGVRIKFHSKTQAIETLARHLSMYRDNVDLNVNVSLADLVNGSYKLEPPTPKVIEHQATEHDTTTTHENKPNDTNEIA